MAHIQQTKPSLALVAIVSALIVGTPVSSASLPCDEALAQIWSVDDATSFERIDSQIEALKANAGGEQASNFVNFPNEDDGC